MSTISRTPTIRLQDYTNFEAKITLPVVEDSTLKLDARLRRALVKPLTLRLDDAIQCADRHLYISRPRTANPAKIIRDWTNLLRWELSTFWECDPSTNSFHDDRGQTTFSWEHPRRSGELLAEGIAILLLETNLSINRNRLFFYSNGGEARPDFIVHGRARIGNGLIYNSRKFALEARSRAGIHSIHAKDYPSLAAKKGKTLTKKVRGRSTNYPRSGPVAKSPFSSVLAVYTSYGAHPTPGTRVIVGDPKLKDRTLGQWEELEVILYSYHSIFARYGINHHLTIVEQLLDLRRQKMPLPDKRKDPGEKGDRALNHLHHNQKVFVGRFFSDLPDMVERGEIDRAQALTRVESDPEHIPFFFAGVDETLLRLIRTYDWDELLDYRLRETTVPGAYFGTDGTAKFEKLPPADISIVSEALIQMIRERR